MASYAYRDKDRKNIIYSHEVIEEDRNTAFFCPNPKCSARLYICAIDGSKMAYFRATKPKFKHIANCPFKNNGKTNFDSDKYDESKFVFDDAIDNLLSTTQTSLTSHNSSAHKKGKFSIHPPRTLRQIYCMCKSMSVKSLYSGKEVGEMILDDRSEYRYPKGCFGNKIIEATTNDWIYDTKNKEIYLTAPINSKKYTFILSFLDGKKYTTIRNEIFNNSNKIIVVAGKWKPSGKDDNFISEVNSKKQVLIINKQN